MVKELEADHINPSDGHIRICQFRISSRITQLDFAVK